MIQPRELISIFAIIVATLSFSTMMFTNIGFTIPFIGILLSILLILLIIPHNL